VSSQSLCCCTSLIVIIYCPSGSDIVSSMSMGYCQFSNNSTPRGSVRVSSMVYCQFSKFCSKNVCPVMFVPSVCCPLCQKGNFSVLPVLSCFREMLDKILSLHSLAHSAKINFNFFRTYGLHYVINFPIYVYNDVD